MSQESWVEQCQQMQDACNRVARIASDEEHKANQVARKEGSVSDWDKEEMQRNRTQAVRLLMHRLSRWL